VKYTVAFIIIVSTTSKFTLGKHYIITVELKYTTAAIAVILWPKNTASIAYKVLQKKE
jgi:hypothetical protein